jgi:uncharacterized membrane protein YphA (DoxX/SURF4 family)
VSSALIVWFARSTVFFVFLYSGLAKLRTRRQFESVIRDVRLVPARWTRVVVYLVLFSEATAVVLAGIGGRVLPTAFLLGIVLLVGFSTVLGITLYRKINVGCNCFGNDGRSVSPYDIGRNAIFISVFGTGLLIGWSRTATAPVSDLILYGLMSVVFVFLVVNLHSLVDAFKPLEDE